MSVRRPTHPGAGIRDDLAELGWTVTEAARRMGVRRENLSLLIHGQIGVSPKMALALERVGISNAEFWMRRQAGYELAQERLRQEREVSVALSGRWSRCIPDSSAVSHLMVTPVRRIRFTTGGARPTYAPTPISRLPYRSTSARKPGWITVVESISSTMAGPSTTPPAGSR